MPMKTFWSVATLLACRRSVAMSNPTPVATLKSLPTSRFGDVIAEESTVKVSACVVK